jgi:Ceramidase
MNQDLLAAVDNYCERTDPSFWSEPLNALTNAAFLVAAATAVVLWRRADKQDWPSLWLIAVAAIVGIGSFLFHTFANRWSLLADVIPIAVFIYSYFLLALRRYLGLGIVAAVLVTACFAAFNMNFDRIWYAVVGPYSLNGSIGYLPAATALMVIGGAALSKRADMAGRGLLLAAAIFAVSLTFRSIDEAACATLPMGTHFLWHTLNAVVLFVLLRTAIADRVRSSREGDLR